MRERHGMFGTPEYNSWLGMKNRVLNPNHQSYNNYGGRGIKISDRWVNSFLNFYSDVGPRPGPGYSIDRIDNDGNYEPGNVKWSTRKEQNSNKRVYALASNNKSGVKGVTPFRNKWRSTVRVDGKNIQIAVSDTIEEAALKIEEFNDKGQ